MRIEIEPGVRLFVDIEGEGLVPDGAWMREKPTLILLHGGPGFDHSAFKPAFGALADLAQIVYYDHRGHGRSDPRPSSEWTLDTWADDIVRLCDALGIVKPIVLGQSFGGFVAQRYIERHPEHPGKVILSSTSHHMGLDRKIEGFVRRGGEGVRDKVRALWTEPTPLSFAAYWEACRDLYTATPQTDPMAAQRTLLKLDILLHFIRGEMQGMRLLPGLARARCPVLVVAGEEDPVCPLQDALEIADALPTRCMQLARFPGCGHGVWRDNPGAAFERLRRFIQE
ncbi:alpha/beta fold hydrolase [Roseateles sp. DB2]|uniref:alpha/beta fold hydrolase n=1 Tax=Roseateles sp. DB2 TaxID=3453717 RepID=UPI003EEA0E00